MPLRDYLIRKLGGVPMPARTHVMQAGRGGVGFGGARKEIAPGVRVGSWVRWEGRTAIVTGSQDNLIAIDIVDDAGHTVMGTHQPWGQMRKATASEIPQARRPDAATLRNLGYAEQ